MKFLRSILVDAHTMATEVKSWDLPINPISHIILTIEGTALTTIPTLTEILAFINSIEVTHRGISVLNMESEDLAALNLYLYGSRGKMIADVFGTSTYVSYSIIIPFGRTLYNPDECFPGSRKGEFKIKLDTTIPATSFNVAVMSLETIELPEANPSNFLKSTLLSIAAPGATGIFDTELPIGNKLLAIILGLTAYPTTGDVLYTVDDLKLLCDNVEHQFASSKTPALISDIMLRSNKTLDIIPDYALGAPDYYFWLDFDPTKNGAFAVNTDNFNSIKLRCTYGENAAINLIPVELVSV